MFNLKKNCSANIIRFSIKANQAIEFWKTSGFFGRVFSQSYHFSMEANQN